MADKTLVTSADHRSMLFSYAADEDLKRAKAIVCVGRSIEDPQELLEILQMLGLVDEEGKFIKIQDMSSHDRVAANPAVVPKGKAWN